jgi:hypothetical protein
MPRLGKRGLRVLKAVHLVTACLWTGGSVGLNLMIVLLAGPESGGELFGYDQARKLVDDLVVIPGAIGCLATGLLFALFSNWGFFKHRWLAVKWVLTVFCIAFGTFFLGPRINGRPPLSGELGLAALQNPEYLAFQSGLATGGPAMAALIVFMVVISVFKPWKKAQS